MYALVSKDLPRRIARTKGSQALAAHSGRSIHQNKWAQLMRYWQWSVTPVGTPSFPITILTSTGYVFQNQALRGAMARAGHMSGPTWSSAKLLCILRVLL